LSAWGFSEVGFAYENNEIEKRTNIKAKKKTWQEIALESGSNIGYFIIMGSKL